MNNKVVIIGCGNVGMSYAYALVNQRTYVNKLMLIDLDESKVEGEVMDLNHCLSYAPSKISINKGTYQDCSDARIVVIAAGANQKPGETRTDLIHKNAKIFKDIIDNVMASGFNGIFVVATNPLDVMTYLTYKYSGLSASRVIGSGTSLDTARLQLMIGKKLCISPKNIQAYVIGEHGDSEFIPWSNANISLQSIKQFFTEEELNNILSTYLVAKVDDKIVGYIGVMFVMDECHVLNIAVDTNYRKMGIATKLVTEVFKYCKEHRTTYMMLEVRVTNIPAQKLYSKLGFKDEVLRKDYYRNPDGTREDALVMSLEF